MPDSGNKYVKGRVFEVIMLVMAGGVLFLTGIVVYALVTGGPTEADIQNDIKVLAVDMKQAQQANACTAYQNHRAIEQALRDIATLNEIETGSPRVLPTDETISSCRAVGIDLDANGVPDIGPNHTG